MFEVFGGVEVQGARMVRGLEKFPPDWQWNREWLLQIIKTSTAAPPTPSLEGRGRNSKDLAVRCSVNIFSSILIDLVSEACELN